MDGYEARQAVADAGRELLIEGLVARTWGNVSCRTGADHFVITPSGLGYDIMTAEDVVPFCMTDGSYEGSRKPSSEKGVHTAAYRQFPDAGFVIHTHQRYASAIGLAGFSALPISPEDREALGGLALAAYGLPGTKKLSRNVAKALSGGAHCVLMAHHGALIVGRDAEEAFSRAQLLESVCRAACQGQPETTVTDTGAIAELTDAVRARFGHAAFTADAAVVAASRLGNVPAQLDDMAQMIGARLIAVEPEEKTLFAALTQHDAVLVRGLGAVCRAHTEGDLAALCQLAEKASAAYLHTRARHVRARLSPIDTALMRRVYVKKYAKQIGG